jgi:dGTPase
MDDLDLHDSVRTTVSAYGMTENGVRIAHKDGAPTGSFTARLHTREVKEEHEEKILSDGATRALGAGERALDEEADVYATCFEVDVARIRTAAAFRRMAGKAQVFVAPRNDMLRNRLTHVLEVAQVATIVADALGLNVALAEAIALGHDCGHGPGGHPAEEAFSGFLSAGFDHAVWGADVVLAPLNLCSQTLDGIRNHSWKRPAPMTPEGAVVAWSDRVNYVCHDWDDALRANIVADGTLPEIVARKAGTTQQEQLAFFTRELITASAEHGTICMRSSAAEVLDAFRTNNFERIYLRPSALEQSEKVVHILTSLVEFLTRYPANIPDVFTGTVPFPRSSEEAAHTAVAYVASMTDRYAFATAKDLLGLPDSMIPRSV